MSSIVELKIGRRTFGITNKDVVLYNGACWQLITQTYFVDRCNRYPLMSKAMCDKFVKKGILVMYKKKGVYATEDEKQMGLYYYKFDVDKLNEYISQ